MYTDTWYLKFVLRVKVESALVFHLLNSCRWTNPPILESPEYNLGYCPFLLSHGWPWTCVCSTSSQLHFCSAITISNIVVWGLWTGASNCRTREATTLCYVQDCAAGWLLHHKKCHLRHFHFSSSPSVTFLDWCQSLVLGKICMCNFAVRKAVEKVFETGAETATGLMSAPHPRQGKSLKYNEHKVDRRLLATQRANQRIGGLKTAVETWWRLTKSLCLAWIQETQKG